MAFVPIRTVVGTDEEDTGFKPLRDVYLGPAPQRGAIAAGLSAGVDQLQGLGYSALGGVADIVGASGVRDFANEQARRNQIDASVGGRPDLELIEDQSLSSALPYLGYQISKQVPTMAGIVGAQFIPGAGQVAGALGLTRLGAVAPRMLGGSGLQAGSSIAARRAALAQGEALGTGTLAGSAMGFGSLYGESVEGGDPSPFKALALAPIYGAAEAVLPAVLQGSLRAPARFSGNIGTRMAKAGGVAGAGESLTELGQNELEMGMRSDLTDEEIASRRLNAAAAGLVVGGSLGTVGGLRGPVDLTKPDTEQETQTSTEQKPILGLQYNPLAGTPIIFPDGTVALGSEQEMLARTGIKMPAAAAAGETDLTAPAGTTAATKPTTPSIFSETDTALNKLGVKPTKNSRGIYDYLVAEGIDPASPEAEPVMNALAASKVGEARKAVGEIIRARSTRGTPVSTVQQPAGGVGAGSLVVQGGVGDAGRVAPVAGTVVGGTPAAGAPLRQAGILSVAPGQPSTTVTTGAPSGPQATQAIQATPQRQEPTTRGAPGTTALIDTSEDALEIARATGNASEIEAMREDEAGLRADQRDFTEDDLNAVIEEQLGKGKNADRDRQILRAYITARRAVPSGYKGNIAKEIADSFGIAESRVRQIGNPEKLADIAVSMGFDRAQVFDRLGIQSAQKALATELSKLEGELTRLKAKAKPTKADIARMAELDEQITRINDEVESGDMASAFKEAGIEGEAGEAFGNLDDAREWQKASTAGSQMAVKLVSIADTIAELKSAAAELQQLGLSQAEAAATARIEELTAEYEAIVSGYEAKPEAAPKKAKGKGKIATQATEEKDAAKEAEAAKFRAERAAKLQADRNGLAVGDTVKNPKLGTGVVKSFAGDGDATTVTVDFQSGQTKELSVKLAKLEKTDAVQVESAASVPVQPKADSGKKDGGQVRRVKKPAAESKAQVPAVVRTEAEQAAQAWDVVAADFPEAPKFADLTKAQQNTFIGFGEGNWERGDVETELTKLARAAAPTQRAIGREPVTIDVEARVVEETVGPQIAKLPEPQIIRLENHYNARRDTPEFMIRVRDDVVAYVNKGAQAVAGAIRSTIKAIADGVLAVALIFNPNVTLPKFDFDVPNITTVIEEVRDVRATVPENARAKMSDLAQSVYAKMAPVAIQTGKGFIIADKPNGMLHVFNPDGSMLVQDAALYGKDAGDKLDGKSKITPAGKFTLEAHANSEYAGGVVLAMPETMDSTGLIAVHAAFLGNPKENRLGRLSSPSTADNKISYGCINTAHKTFTDKIVPNIEAFNGGMIMVLPDDVSTTDAMFQGTTETVTRRVDGRQPSRDPKTAGVDRTMAAKEEEAELTKLAKGGMKFGKDDDVKPAKAKNPYTAKELLAELKDFIRADIPGRKLLIVDSIEDLLRSPDKMVRAVGAGIALEGAYGVAVNGRAYLIANRIQKGAGRAKFMHEVGAHLGLEKLLPKAQYDKLTQQILNWAKKDDGSIESELALLAVERVQAAGTKQEDRRSEMLAYFIEEAMEAGIDPIAGSKTSGPLTAWFRTLWAAFKTAARKLGFKTESMNAQDVVNLAFGAARLEINGTWHGTAASFRKFSNEFMGTGEGAQADPQRMKFGSDMVELGKRGQLKEKAGKTRVDTANDRAIKLLEKADKTKDPAEAASLRAEANALFRATAGKLSGMKFGINMPPQGVIDRNIAKLPKMAQQPVKRLTEALGDLGGKTMDYAVFTNELVKRAVAVGLPSAKVFADRLASRSAKVSEEERKIEKIADRYASIEDANKGNGPGSVNEFLFESTRTNKWGYDTPKIKADPAMKVAFNKLGPKAQQFVKDVFAHGDSTLSNKKKIVIDAANSEYDAMIKAAQDALANATDAKAQKTATAELAKLKAEKVATLKRFQTLFAVREGMPYAPIKRTGNYVVIGESAAYKAAKAKKDTATLKKLESDPDHYHVSFVDTKWQARNLKDNLAAQGVFTDTQIAKRAEAFDEMFSGEAALPALTKMRNAVDARATTPSGAKDPSAGKLLNIISQLYLEALAEGSARKSELRRRGVAGEVDMLQSFTQQGRADANFLASIEFEPQIQEALQQMRTQSRTGDRERKSEIFDELTKRYAGTMDMKQNPFINGLTNLASKFFLASSPAYYMQNLTQPFMMSLPAMAGRHDYVKSSKALFKAYSELGPLFKDVKLFDEQFDFSKVPADVRAAINELVNQGKVDIGLATEINEYKVEADGKLSQFAQRLNKGMRLAVQKTEAINRLSTAIAAYRLEFERAKNDPKIADPEAAATQYAADILTDTHGDYTAFNAPRVFNTQWGKVALQFRKFQLIQIAFYYKLFRDAFTKPDERAVALKTLSYALGHTAVFAGMMGLPGYAAVSAILSAFGDEDEPYDLTADMRKKIGPEWADIIMRGAPTASVVGMDLSGKIGAGNMLSIMPFSNADLSTNAGRAEAFGTLMGGAALGMTSRVVDGLGLIASGDYYKGIERTMPKGVSDALKAGRQGAEGMTRRNGDVILPDSEISTLDTVFTALGVPVAEQTVTFERQNRMRDVTKNFTERTTRIKNDYVKAVREKDTAAMAEARTAWTKLQQTRQRNGLTPQPVSNLLKAPQEQKAREQRTVGGVAYRQGQQKLAESIAEN